MTVLDNFSFSVHNVNGQVAPPPHAIDFELTKQHHAEKTKKYQAHAINDEKNCLQNKESIRVPKHRMRWDSVPCFAHSVV